MGFRVWGLALKVWRGCGSGFVVCGLLCSGLEFRVSGIVGLWFRVYGLGVLSVGFEGSGFGVYSPPF